MTCVLRHELGDDCESGGRHAVDLARRRVPRASGAKHTRVHGYIKNEKGREGEVVWGDEGTRASPTDMAQAHRRANWAFSPGTRSNGAMEPLAENKAARQEKGPGAWCWALCSGLSTVKHKAMAYVGSVLLDIMPCRV